MAISFSSGSAHTKTDIINSAPVAPDGFIITIGGLNSVNDGLGGDFQLHSSSTATADDFDILEPNSAMGGAGRYIRINFNALGITQSQQSRPIDSTSFRPSTTRSSFVSYSVSADLVSVIGGNKNILITLQISPDDSAWQDVCVFESGLSGVAATGATTGALFGFVPAAWYVRMVTTTTNTGIGGSASSAFVQGQETLI